MELRCFNKTPYHLLLIIIVFGYSFSIFWNNYLFTRVDSMPHMSRSIFVINHLITYGSLPRLYPNIFMNGMSFSIFPYFAHLLLGVIYLFTGELFYTFKYFILLCVLFTSLSIYFFTRIIGIRKERALLSALLVIICTPLWFNATVTHKLNDMVALPLLFLFLGFFYHYLKKDHLISFLISSLLFCLTLLTHPSMIIAFFWPIIILFLVKFKSKGWRVISPLIIGLLLSCFWFIPFVNEILSTTGSIDNWLNMPSIDNLITPYGGGSIDDNTSFINPLILVPGLISLFIVLKNPKKGSVEFILSLLSVYMLILLIPGISDWLFYLKPLDGRRLPIFIGLSFCLIAPLGFEKKYLKVVYLLVFFSLPFTYSYISYYSSQMSNGLLLDAAHIGQQIGPGPSIVLIYPDNQLVDALPFASNVMIPSGSTFQHATGDQFYQEVKKLHEPDYLTNDTLLDFVELFGVNYIIIDKLAVYENQGMYSSLIKKAVYSTVSLVNNGDFEVVFNKPVHISPDDLSMMFSPDRFFIVNTTQPYNLVIGGEVIDLESNYKFLIKPLADELIVRFRYSPHWHAIGAEISESTNGLILLKPTSDEVLIEYYDELQLIGYVISLVTVMVLLVYVIRSLMIY